MLRIRKRLLEVVAGGEAWEKVKRQARRESGEPAADRAATKISERRARLYAELGRTPARTPAGILAQISVAAYDVDVFRDVFTERRGIEPVLASSVLDAVALIGDSSVAFCGKSAKAFASELRAHITGEA